MDRMEFSTLVSRATRGEVIDIAAVNQGADATRRDVAAAKTEIADGFDIGIKLN